MHCPTTRVLTVLELLQSHSSMTGAEIARRLGVDVRTARRYIFMLEDLGIPVTADRGRYGGYRLMPGFRLPPLMLNEDEALAVTVGLLAARHMGLAAPTLGVEGALAKVERVLPERVRSRLRAVKETLVWDLGEPTGDCPDSNAILTLSSAAGERRQVTLHYRKEGGEETVRIFDPYGLGCRRGLWYAIGHCHLRGCLRLFRLDRVTDVTAQETVFERPVGFDVLAAVQTSLGSVPRHFSLEVMLDTTLEVARRHLSVSVATLEAADSGVVLRGYTDDLDWMARMLARVGCGLEIRRPPELRDALRRHAEEIILWASGTPRDPSRKSTDGNRTSGQRTQETDDEPTRAGMGPSGIDTRDNDGARRQGHGDTGGADAGGAQEAGGTVWTRLDTGL